MKKALLSVLSAGLVASAVAPLALANENPINGGAGLPNYSQQPKVAGQGVDAYNSQTEFVSARTVEEYLNGHMNEIKAKAAQDPAVVAAKKEFDAVEGGSHLYGEKKAAYEAAFNTAFLNVRNEYVQKFQNVHNTAKKAEGKYYILNETPEQANARYEKEHGVKLPEGAQVQDKLDKNGKPVVLDKNGKVINPAAKAAGKKLPKTSAAK